MFYREVDQFVHSLRRERQERLSHLYKTYRSISAKRPRGKNRYVCSTGEADRCRRGLLTGLENAFILQGLEKTSDCTLETSECLEVFHPHEHLPF